MSKKPGTSRANARQLRSSIRRLVAASDQLGQTSTLVARLKLLGRWILTFHIVCVAWILFRARSFDDATDFMIGLLTSPRGGPVSWSVVGVVVVALGLQFVPGSIAAKVRLQLSRLHPVTQGALLGLWIALVVALGPQGVSPFIYFQF